MEYGVCQADQRSHAQALENSTSLISPFVADISFTGTDVECADLEMRGQTLASTYENKKLESRTAYRRCSFMNTICYLMQFLVITGNKVTITCLAMLHFVTLHGKHSIKLHHHTNGLQINFSALSIFFLWLNSVPLNTLYHDNMSNLFLVSNSREEWSSNDYHR